VFDLRQVQRWECRHVIDRKVGGIRKNHQGIARFRHMVQLAPTQYQQSRSVHDVGGNKLVAVWCSEQQHTLRHSRPFHGVRQQQFA
jgi:hypothetical protein